MAFTANSPSCETINGANAARSCTMLSDCLMLMPRIIPQSPPSCRLHASLHPMNFIWLTASARFQRCTSLKTSPPCQPDGPEQGTQPTIPSIQRPQTPPHMARRPVGTLREHGGRGLGAMPRPLAACHCSALCHCSPPFTMIRTSFAGWRFRSLLTCAVVFSGFRAHIHMPNDLATIIADITFRSHRRVNTSSW